MADKLTVGELVYKISGDMDNLQTELKKAETEIKNIKASMEKNTKASDKLVKGFNLLKTAVAGFVSGALLKLIGGMVKSGSELESLRGSFNNLATDIGLDSDEVLNSLSKLSGGTISQKDIILSANRAMVLGVAKNMDEFNTLMQTARLRARDMGLTTTQAFDNIVTGIGRGSPLILDNLGFVISATQAQENYAKELGVTVDQLTEVQKKEAIKTSILKQGNEEIERAGEITNNYSDRIQQVSTVIVDLKDNIGRALLPAMASLLNATLDSNDELKLTTQEVDKLGKSFYVVANAVIVLGRIFRNFIGVLQIISQAFVTLFSKNIERILGPLTKLAKVLGINTDVLDKAKNAFGNFSDATLDNFQNTADKLVKNNEKLGKSLTETFNPVGYKGLGDKSMTRAMEDVADATGTVATGSEDAKKALDDFQNKMLDLISKSKDVRDALEKDLSGALSSFADNIKGNVEDSVTSLAQLVVDAEQKIKDLRDKLVAEDDPNQRQNIQKQIDEQQKILESRAGFEERQAKRILDIRTKLEEAGIDVSQAGLDALTDTRTLEQQIEEERRLASLDEFARFEEQQSKKLEILATSLITEVTLIKGKIETQEQYEDDLTAYLQSEESKRLSNTESWAKSTIDKYKEVSESLQTFLSLQSRVAGLNVGTTGSIPTTSPSDIQSTIPSSINTSNKTINAPITINSQAQKEIDFKSLAREMGFEVNRL